MILYHGSVDFVTLPEIRASKGFLDFGPGFYTTGSFEQAERWSNIKAKRLGCDSAYSEASLRYLHYMEYVKVK